MEGKNGSSELLFGVGFSPFSKPLKEQQGPAPGRRLEILPHTGISFSKSADPDKKSDYAVLPGLNSGVFVKFWVDTAFSLVSGARVERKGYRMDKPGQSRVYYDYAQNAEQTVSFRSDVSFDYLTIPLLEEVSFGNRFTTNIQFGLYYSLLQINYESYLLFVTWGRINQYFSHGNRRKNSTGNICQNGRPLQPLRTVFNRYS